MPSLDDFSEITLRDEPLAPHTYLKLGGPAQYFITPRNRDELAQVILACRDAEMPYHILGGGCNLLIADKGVSGVVIHVGGGNFSQIEISGTTVTVGAGAKLTHLISQTVKAGLQGLEVLVGIPGTVGGALRGNAGGSGGDIGQFVTSVTGLTSGGEQVTRSDDEITFGYRDSNLRDLLIIEASFDLQPGDTDEITRRLRKTWIMKKATQPLTAQSAGCIFKNPRGMSAGLLIDQSGLKGTRIGNAEISDRHANFIITHPDASSDDVLRLIELAKSRVAEQFGVDLELEIEIW